MHLYGKGLKMKNREEWCTVNWSADTLPVLDRGEIHLVSEFIWPMYNSAAGALTGAAAPSNSAGTWPLWNRKKKKRGKPRWLLGWVGIYFKGKERQKCNHTTALPNDSPQAAGVGCIWATTYTNKSHTRQHANSRPAFLKESDQLMRLSNSRITNAPHRPLRKRNTHVVSIIYWKSFSFSPPGQFQPSGGGPEITHRMRRRISPGEGRCWCYVLEADRRRRCANSHDGDARLWCFFFFFFQILGMRGME